MFDEAEDADSERCLSWVSALLAESHAAEASLVGLERLLRAVPDRRELFRQLLESPRAIEVLLRIFAASPYLTDILLLEPALLEQLTQPRLLADLRSRPEFLEARWCERRTRRRLTNRPPHCVSFNMASCCGSASAISSACSICDR